eukprot:219373_1
MNYLILLCSLIAFEASGTILHQWVYNQATTGTSPVPDSKNPNNENYKMTLLRGAKITSEGLQCSGGYGETAGNIPAYGTISHTLEARVKLTGVAWGVSPVALDSDYNPTTGAYRHRQFDAIVNNENSNDNKWIAGSDYFRRTKKPMTGNGVVAESLNEWIHIMISYNVEHNLVTIYRNGEQYGDSYRPAGGFMNINEQVRALACVRASKPTFNTASLIGTIAYARIHKGAKTPADVTSCSSADVFLSNLQVSSDLIGWNDGGPKGVNSWFGHTTMLMGNGHTYNNFLVIHPPPNDGFAYKRYTLNGDYSRFSAVVGVARTSNGCENKANYGSFRVDIVIDNVVKYTRTGYAQLGDGSYDNVGIDVSGANVLEIRTYRATDNYFCDHPAIANPLLSCGGNYVFVTDKKTFTQAKEYCINSYPGGHLAVISGRVENEKVTEKCRYIGQLQHACWIGLTNPAISRGKWMDGKPITYTNWYDGGDGGSSQPCTTMRADGLWHTVGYCENGGGDALPFICEYTVSGAYSKPGLFLENLSFDSSGISMYWMYTIAILLFINVVCFAIYWCKCG